jgi:hypothetical protein
MIISNNKKTLTLTLSSILLISLTSFSYIYFTGYQPKVLRKLEEVKGIRKVNAIELLYPDNAEKISFNQTADITQVSYRTLKSQEYIKTFYKNLFTDMGLKEESIKKTDTSLIYKFKGEGKAVTVITQKETDSTLVSVEIAKR